MSVQLYQDISTDPIQQYFSQGILAFPFQSISTTLTDDGKIKKNPVGFPKNWQTLEEKDIMNHNGGKCVAIITGKKSNITVIDVDSESAYLSICAKYETIGNHYAVKTNKGYHLYFLYDDTIKTGVNCFTNIEGVDIRNDNACVYAPPSKYILPNGNEVKYVVDNSINGGMITPIPNEIKALINSKYILSKDSIPIESPKIKKADAPVCDNKSVEKFLNLIDDKYIDSRDDWLKIIGACKSCNVDEQIARQFSMKSAKYSDFGFNGVWKCDYPNITLGTIRHYANISNPSEYKKLCSKSQSKLGGSVRKCNVKYNHHLDLPYDQINTSQILDSFVEELLEECNLEEEYIKYTHHYALTLDESYYNDDVKCTQLGSALKQTSEKLFITWLKFISQSDTFDWEAVPELFNKWTDLSNSGYNYRTIKNWSKAVNPTKYEEILDNSLDKYIHYSFHNATDFDIANAFFQMNGENHIWQNGTHYIYFKDKWRIDDKCRYLKEQIQTILYDKYFKYIRKVQNQNRESNNNDSEEAKDLATKFCKITKILKTFTSVGHIADNFLVILSSKQADVLNVFDNKPYVFCFANLAFDLQTGLQYEVKKDDFITQNTHYNYEEPTSEQLKQIDKLFVQIFPDEEIRKCYLYFLFSGMTGIQLEKFIIANGKGRNGKGLINELFENVLGNDYFYKLPVDCLTSKSDLSKGASPQVANMHKKRCVISSEPDDDANTKIRMNTVKDMTGCKTLSARQLYSSDTVVRMDSTSIVEMNTKLKLSGKIDESVLGRIVDIPFVSFFTDDETRWDETEHIYPVDTRFKSSDFQLGHRCAMFKYILDNAPKELYIPDVIRDRSRNYVLTSDEIWNWFEEQYERTDADTDVLKMTDIYKLFQESDYFCSMTKDQKRLYNKKGFIERVSGSVAFSGFYFNTKKKIGGITYNERIIKFIKRCKVEVGEDGCEVEMDNE